MDKPRLLCLFTPITLVRPMKAERRHELKTNSLAKSVENAPAFFQQYGSRILLVVILCLLAIILVKKHIRDNEDKAKLAAKSLGGALYALDELRTIPMRSMPTQENPRGGAISPEKLAELRRNYAKDAEGSIAEALTNADDPKVQAQAWIVRGDLNWELANFPVLPGASNTDKTSDEYLNEAEKAYKMVLQAPMNDDHPSVVAAHYGLGKVAENRGQWDKAKAEFQQIADDPSADKAMKEWAKNSVEQLATLQKPVYAGTGAPEPIVPMKTPPTTGEFGPPTPSGISTTRITLPGPTTAPSLPATGPAIVPATLPTSAPAAESTSPTLPTISAPSPSPIITTAPTTAPSATTRPVHP